MKKALIVVGVLIVLVVGITFSLPFIIDLNKYKGQITDLVEQKIHGKFDFEKIAFRGLGVQVRNISLSTTQNFRQKNILKVGEVKVKASFLSLLTANPKVTIMLRKPEIYLVKNELGKLNLAELPKKDETSPEQQVKAKSATTKLPALILGAKLSFLAENASLKYIDEKANQTTAVDNLNISLNNAAFNSPIDFNVSAVLSQSKGKASLLEGNVFAKGKAKLVASGSRELKSIELDTQFGLGDLEASIKGEISDLNTLKSDITISTPTLSLSRVKNSFGPLKGSNLDGTFSLNGTLKGPIKQLDQCFLNAKVNLNLQGNGTDLKVTSNLSNTLNHLKGDFKVSSSSLNLDALLPKKTAFILFPVAYAATPMTSLGSNPIFKGLEMKGDIDLKKMTYRQSDFTDVEGRVSVDDAKVTLSSFNLNAFKGKASLKGNVDFKSQNPKFVFSTTIQNFQTNPMLQMASPNLKDVLHGTLNANMDLSGSGLAMASLKQTMSGTGKVDLKDVEMKGLNMGKELKEKLQLLSVFSGSEILNEDLESKINFIRSSLIIRDGKLFTPDGTLEAPGYAATLKGYASFERDIDFKGDLLLPAKKLSRSLASLANEKGQVAFPFMLTGKLPKFSLQIDAQKVASKALKSTITDELTKKAKEKLGIDLPVDLPF